MWDDRGKVSFNLDLDLTKITFNQDLDLNFINIEIILIQHKFNP